MKELNTLADVRDAIDAIDEQILTLISERARCAERVAELKSTVDNPVFYRPEREAQILRRIGDTNPGPLPRQVVVRLFRELISACLAHEQTMRIAYLGPEGTFTQAAAMKHFGAGPTLLPQATIASVFREVEAEQAEYGVVPIENSTEGVINHTLDLFTRSPLNICGEVSVRINHNLIGNVSDLSQIKEVISHQQSLAQCRAWLDTHLPNATRITASSNAEAAKLVVDRTDAVAISSVSAAEIYGLEILVAGIEDEPNNTTRFLIIGRESVGASGNDKTTLLISTRNKPGALYGLLQPLSDNGIDMTRIESRPSRDGLWEYVFFVDIEGHCDNPQVASALAALRDEAALYRVLGSYPKSAVN